MDRFTALRVFRTVVEQGSFAGAARQLGLSPAAVTKNLSELEAQLGVRLLNRTTRRMSRTEAGALYYDRVVRILDALEDADGALGPLQRMPGGVLRVAAPLTLSLTRLSAAMPRFLERYPALSVDLRMEDRRIDLVEEGIDVAIRAATVLPDSSLVSRRLMAMRYVVCGAPSYFARHGMPAVPDDLRVLSCVRFSLGRHVAEWTFHKDGHTVSVPVGGRYMVSSSLAVRDALLAGFGIGLMPHLYVRDDLAAGRLLAALPDWSAGELGVFAVYPSRLHVPLKVRAFLDFVVEDLTDGECGAYAGPEAGGGIG
ncbi:LysR family transcriptional regulator [Azospirillum halopraeferens]|uniref:LysR family transcriptional regulator n=1 Tax=Azospirillum halopraeferens TaxID=34010 RepID=UPI0003F56DD0|nr:LysR family transcriptional regulator [Azospirillum halopraeferens]